MHIRLEIGTTTSSPHRVTQASGTLSSGEGEDWKAGIGGPSLSGPQLLASLWQQCIGDCHPGHSTSTELGFDGGDSVIVAPRPKALDQRLEGTRPFWPRRTCRRERF